MELLDKDLISLQETRTLIKKAKQAQKTLATFSQEKIDSIVQAMANAGYQYATKLAKMANEETGFGIWQDKVIKNIFGSKMVYEAVKNEKTVGIIREDKTSQIIEVAVPVGVIAGIIPSTNPTSTVMYKAIISLKAGNTIVFSPHPSAKKCILETVKILNEAAVAAGCPEGAIGCISVPTLQATQELMKHPNTALILATGGSAMVKAAYSSGTPAIGVGAGNGPAFIDKSADVKLAVKRILDSKTFDNGTICASEQSIIIEKAMEEKAVTELKQQGAYFLDENEKQQLGQFIMRPNGTMNPQIVGKSVETVAKLAGLKHVPFGAKVLIAREKKVGHQYPYSREKLSPILAFYVEDTIDDVLNKTIEILEHEGVGHTFSMHTKDEELIRKFALHVPVARMLINTPSALGGIGGSTNLMPALTLGCGAVGGSSTSNNIGPLDLINIRRVAHGTREIEEIRSLSGESSIINGLSSDTKEEMVALLVKKVLENIIA